MCGIWSCIRFRPGFVSRIESEAIKARGPDKTTILETKSYCMIFNRLAIHDLSVSGDQPFQMGIDGGRKFVYMCNGEIYNYRKLIADHQLIPTSGSDCEVIGLLYQKYGNFEDVVKMLDGEFAIVGIVVVGDDVETIYAARDPYGVRPLYWSFHNGSFIFSSMLAGIPYNKAYHFPPGYVGKNMKFSRYYSPRYYSLFTSHRRIADVVISSVVKRLDSDRPIGFLLSGGLDSSLVVAVATNIFKMKNVRTFSIGMKGGTDLEYARKVAEHCGTQHTEVIFTPLEGLAQIPNVIAATETYDITTIRASVGQYLLAKYIRENTDIRVILNGDGADEAQMGYLYNYLAPNPQSAHNDSLRLLAEIHCFDGLRVDRCLGAHGLEARVPFLDPEFVEVCLNIQMNMRIPTKDRMEKQFIRDAFNTYYPNILPSEVLWRKKEAFSDGVSKITESWSEIIQKATRRELIQPMPHIQPHTSEASFYRKIFNNRFPNQAHILPHYWMPKWSDTKDPSARTLSLKV